MNTRGLVQTTCGKIKVYCRTLGGEGVEYLMIDCQIAKALGTTLFLLMTEYQNIKKGGWGEAGKK